MNGAANSPVQNERDGSKPNESPIAKWWISTEGAVEGPYSTAYVASLIHEARVNPSTLICAANESRWVALRDCEEVVALAREQFPDAFPPSLPATPSIPQKIGRVFNRFTNRQLPWFANAICIYCTIIVPGLFVLGLISTFAGSNLAADLKPDSPIVGYAMGLDLVSFIADLATSCMLVAGGMLLCQLRRQGEILVRAGLAIHLMYCISFAFILLVWYALLTLGEQSAPVREPNSADLLGLLLGLPFFLFCLACVVFEIAALIWLLSRENIIPSAGPSSPN